MLNFIAGVRSSSPAPSSRHLAISSQHLLVQARAHKAMGNLEEAQKSYREAIEKAKIEHEENLVNSQAKRTFEAISNEFLTFLNEFPLNGHSISASVQAKNAQVEYLFEKALSTLGSLELPNKPSLFLVYAHDNPSYGKAEAAISRYLIDKLSQIQINLYSDQTPMGQPSSRAVEDWKEDGKLEDILTSQLCLLPTRLRDDVKPVDKIAVCCSEVLEKYLAWPHYGAFYRELREAYRKDCEQKGTSTIRRVVNVFSQGEEYKAGFHHVLTEMAFLQIRAEQLTEQHGIIPVSLTPKSSRQCLGNFIASTIVRMEDISRFEEQAKAGREMYLNQGQHVVLFKLIERLLVDSDDAQTFLKKFWQGYDKCIFRLNKESSTPGELEFTKLVDSIFGDIEKTLRDQLVLATLQQHKDKVEKLRLPNLSELREALYQHYQRSNLSIQRVSGQQMSLEDCYINLAIVESQAQREKDKEELEKQAATFERLPSSERLEATNPNKLIALEKLFESQKLRDGSEGIPKRILIRGRAGIGKTTLCKKLVYDYQNSALWQDRFESVLWVPLRQLKTHAPRRLEDLLCTQYFAGYENSQAQALSKVFYAHQDKTLFILDGLDEVVGELNEGRPLKDFLQTLLNQTHVVITSRPAGVDANLLDQLDLELETVGFSPANVQVYIEKCVPASNQAAIQQFIHRTPLIQGLVNIPIQLDALCYSWDKLPQNKTVTMAMLYEVMVDKLWRKDGVRLEKQDKGNALASNVIQISSRAKLEKLMADEIHYLGYLAFKGLEEGKIEFSLEELDQCQTEFEDRFSGKELPFSFTTDLKKTSFLHTADVGRPEAERHYHFLHLTFQEFFAAQYLVRHLQAYAKTNGNSSLMEAAYTSLGLMLSQNQLNTFIATHKYNPRYEIVWWMVAGLLKGTPLERFFIFLGQTPRDLIGVRHQQVIMGCLSEARNQLNPETVLGLEKDLMQWFHFEMELSGKSALGRQRTFPEHLLLTSLNQLEGKKKQMIQTLGARQTLSSEGASALIGACQDQDKGLRSAAASALGGQTTLSEAAFNALIGSLQDQEENVRVAAVRALGGRSTLSEAAVQALIGALQDKNQGVRLAAVSALRKQSMLFEAAFNALIGALQDENVYVSSKAARAVVEQKNLSEAAVHTLIGSIQHQDDSVRHIVAKALGEQETLSEAAINALICTLQHQNEDFRYVDLDMLGGQKMLSEAALNVLILALQYENWAVRYAAMILLGGQKMLSEVVVRALIGASQDQEWDISYEVVSALKKQKTLSEASLNVLIGACQDQHKDVRKAAASALGGQGTQSEAVLNTLIGACQDESEDVREAAASALGGQATQSEAVLNALIGACQDESEGVRKAAASALGGQGAPSKAVLNALIGACQDQHKDVRKAAASALGRQGAQTEAVLNALIGACQDESEDVRKTAASALSGQATQSEAVLNALIGTCQDESEDVRKAAASALGGQGAQTEAVLDALIGALQDKNQGVRKTAMSALGGLGAQSEAVLNALIGALQDKDHDVRKTAASVLGRQGAQSEAVLNALIGACQGQHNDVIKAAASALGRQGAQSEAILNVLLGALQHEIWEGRYMAANALVYQATQSEAVLNALVSALQDQHNDVRYAAVTALRGHAMSSDVALNALIGALQDKNGMVRSKAADALKGQSAQSEAAFHALISALQHQDSQVKSAAMNALEFNLNQLYSVLPILEVEQIEMLYRRILFSYNCDHMTPLYVQGNQLHFYTAAGPGQPIDLSDRQSQMITKAFKTVQAEAGIISAVEEALASREE